MTGLSFALELIIPASSRGASNCPGVHGSGLFWAKVWKERVKNRKVTSKLFFFMSVSLKYFYTGTKIIISRKYGNKTKISGKNARPCVYMPLRPYYYFKSKNNLTFAQSFQVQDD
jgi:hypothetical protein